METQIKEKEESFREHLSTLDESGDRKWIYPKKPKGKYYRARTIVSIFLLAILFGGPFIRIGGEPILLLNIIQRKFVIFGQIFWPQDFILFGIGFITLVVFVILFTVVYGRLFCGWVCPQTIFMEMLFRKIEYWIEGDWKHQMALNKQPWNAQKIWKKSLKHLIFFAISFLIANTFLAYIIGSKELIHIITDSPKAHLGGLSAITVFSGLFYGVFAFFREQVCTNVCPYGRMQGVMLDRNSVVVTYDYKRGENRAKFHKGEDRKAADKGDCIDCHHCVDVCPTGIDIRHGTQLECINCTACIDACNEMMEGVGLPTGLIRYDSEEGISTRKPFRFTGRMKAYSFVLFLLVGVLVTLIATRSDTETTILRSQGTLYYNTDDGKIENVYNYTIVNKSTREMDIKFKVLKGDATIKMVGNHLYVEKNGLAEGVLFIVFNKSEITSAKTKVLIGVYSGEKLLEKVSTNFIGPITQ